MSKWTRKDKQYSSGHFNMEDCIKERETRELEREANGLPPKNFTRYNQAIAKNTRPKSL